MWELCHRKILEKLHQAGQARERIGMIPGEIGSDSFILV